MKLRVIPRSPLFALVVFCLTAFLSSSAPSHAGEGENADRWTSKGKVSFVRTTGNTDSESLAGELHSSYEPQPSRYYLKASALYAEQDGEKSANRWFVEHRYERDLTERLFGWASASYLKDKFAGYASQATFGPGVGYQFIHADAMKLKGRAGILYTFEDYPGPGKDDYASGKLNGEFLWKVRQNVEFGQTADYVASLSDADVYFLTSETSLDVKINDAIALGVGYIVEYRNAPPAGARHTDTRFLTSLIVNF